jgi:helicase
VFLKTSEYSYFDFPFENFNPVQAEVIPYALEDCNIILSAQTAVGKTAIAEAIFGYHMNCGKGKVVYISPFKSLSSEKYDSWSNNDQLSKHGIVINTGDFQADKQQLLDDRILIFTCDSFLSKMRNKSNWDWLKDIECLVLDEAHIIGDKSRGSRVEVALMKFAKFNNKSRIVMLSATMTNVLDIAKWVKTLNGKSTKYFKSNWRPVELEIKYHGIDDTWDNKISEVIEKIGSKFVYEKIIVFVHSKALGKEIVKRLNKNGIMAAFHNASVSKQNRSKIESML